MCAETNLQMLIYLPEKRKMCAKQPIYPAVNSVSAELNCKNPAKINWCKGLVESLHSKQP